MSALTVRLPESLHNSIKELARKEGISVNQFIASAAGEKMAVLKTLDYLRNEAAQGRREDFERFLAAVPDNEPLEGDERAEF
ncbi:MAG: toxin-antitoxin system HicB family antitoxin [Sulfurimicrobium sp.]|nr:toxin-antitoxin system HicB family antitoxin [Sulfurimicrobium sp.]